MDQKIKRIQSAFGGALDPDVVQAVLEMFDGNVNDAISFLGTQGNGEEQQNAMSFQELQQQSESGLPKNYPAQGPKVLSDIKPSKKDKKSVIDKILHFLNVEGNYEDHYNMQIKHYDLYISIVVVQLRNSVEFNKSSRGRMLAAAWARRDFDLADFLLQHKQQFNLPEVLKAVRLLDAGRYKKQLERKLNQIKHEASGMKLGLLRAKINELKEEAVIGSISGALKRRVCKWVEKTFSAEELEAMTFGLPTAPWRQLADIIHLSPKHFQLDWFHTYVFDDVEALPASAAAQRLEKLLPTISVDESSNRFIDSDTMNALCQINVPYAALRTRANVSALQRALRSHIASYESLATLLWHYEELECADTNKRICQLFEQGKGADLPFGYGKLTERAMIVDESVRQHVVEEANKRLQAIALPLESPVVVLGDASDSMSVAIKCATIVAGGAACLCDATLRFFNDKSWAPDIVPSSAFEVLSTALGTKASGLTTPAAALHEFYKNKIYVSCFVLITDEIENGDYEGMFFPTLYEKYLNEVNKECRIALVSFREQPQKLGRIHSALLAKNIEPATVVALSASRPDSARIDGLLAELACSSEKWRALVLNIAQQVKQHLSTVVPPAVDVAKQQSSSSSSSSSSSAINVVKAPVAHGAIELAEKCLSKAVESKEWQSKDEKEREHDDIDDNVNNEAVQAAARAAPESECVICEERESDTALLECGHFGFCSECAKLLVKCPLCRRNITRRIRIFKQ